MSDVEHTYVDTNNGFGGPALGAGFIAGALADAKSKVNILEQTQSIVSQLKTTGATG